MHGYGSLTFFSILWFFVWVLWIFLLVRVLSDVFRSHDLTGAGKAGWTLVLVVVPYVGVLLYLIFRGSEMHVREYRYLEANRSDLRRYLQGSGLAGYSVADEVGRLADLRNQGSITDQEFETEKARILVAH
jgi:hypothetical protein